MPINQNQIIMNTLIINKNDYAKIFQCISSAKQDGSIKAAEAEQLSKELKSAKLVDPQNVPADVITMNSVVKFHFANTKTQTEIKLVYPSQANIKEKKISIFSAVAIALIGYKVGDEIDWQLPSGSTKIVIDQIVYQPEAQGDYDA